MQYSPNSLEMIYALVILTHSDHEGLIHIMYFCTVKAGHISNIIQNVFCISKRSYDVFCISNVF